MDFSFWLKGLVIGFSIAMPVGPIGVLCIRRSLAEGRKAGLFSGLGAATADALYGCIAGFGLTAISGFLVEQQVWLRLLGGVFLGYLGVKTWLSKPFDSGVEQPPAGHWAAYGSTFFLTLTNPLTILSFVAIFAGLGLAGEGGDYSAAAALVLGVFMGSGLWWLFLSMGVAVLRERFTASGLVWVNRLSAALIFGFGVMALVSLIWRQ